MCEDVEGVAGQLVDDRQTVDLVVTQHVDGVKQTRVRVDVNQWLRIVIEYFCYGTISQSFSHMFTTSQSRFQSLNTSTTSQSKFQSLNTSTSLHHNQSKSQNQWFNSMGNVAQYKEAQLLMSLRTRKNNQWLNSTDNVAQYKEAKSVIELYNVTQNKEAQQLSLH